MTAAATVEQIAIASVPQALPVAVPSVHAAAGHGLDGEYHWSAMPETGQRLTLIAVLGEPCNTLAKLTVRGVLRGLVHRGGLRADLLTGGEIAVGGPVRPA